MRSAVSSLVQDNNEGILLSVPRINNLQNLEIKINFGTSAVLVGANGSGKTRLSVFIENFFKNENILRLVAQRSISMPERIEMSREQDALDARDYGRLSRVNIQTLSSCQKRLQGRYNDKPAIAFISDYDKLLQILFSEKNRISDKFLDDCRQADAEGNDRPETPKSKLEIVQKLWEKILPHRSLKLESWSAKTLDDITNTEYSSSEMSDGEREIFYLIGQCITARNNSLIIVDEPELHLNPALVSALWTEIEKSRPDCAFLYITHDANFSLSRLNAQKFALYSYQNKPEESWDIQEIPQETGIPEDFLIQLVGSRKKILLVEGEKNSWDNLIYSEVYPDRNVIFVGSCSQLIPYMRALISESIFSLHHLDCWGLIDRDRRSESDIEKLNNDRIKVLDFLDIENLFLCEDVFQEVAKTFHMENEIEERWERLQNDLIEEMKNNKSSLAFDFCKKESRGKFKEVFEKKEVSKWGDILQKMNFKEIEDKYLEEIQTAVDEKNFSYLIKYCDMKKGAFPRLAKVFDRDKKGLQAHIERILKKSNDDSTKQNLVDAFRKYLPELD